MKDLVGDKWDLDVLKELSTGDFWTWTKKDGIVYYGDACLGLDKCVDSEKYIWFELENSMLRKHQSVYQEHLKYVRNDILKPFRV